MTFKLHKPLIAAASKFFGGWDFFSGRQLISVLLSQSGLWMFDFVNASVYDFRNSGYGR